MAVDTLNQLLRPQPDSPNSAKALDPNPTAPFSLFPNNQGQKNLDFILETQKGTPKSLKFFYWLSKFSCCQILPVLRLGRKRYFQISRDSMDGRGLGSRV